MSRPARLVTVRTIFVVVTTRRALPVRQLIVASTPAMASVSNRTVLWEALVIPLFRLVSLPVVRVLTVAPRIRFVILPTEVVTLATVVVATLALVCRLSKVPLARPESKEERVVVLVIRSVRLSS